MTPHEKRVSLIADAVRRRREEGSGDSVSLKKSVVSHFVPNPHDKRDLVPKIDVSSLNEILTIDPITRTCSAESGVPFCELVTATLEYNLIPMTVPELKTITVGGAVSGCSLESMSYKYGGFHDSCLEYEIITGTGDIVVCSPDNDGELFHMIHGSYGTLGILTRLTFRLIPAMPFVHMEYHTLRTFDEFNDALMGTCEDSDYDFIDAIIHGPDRFVLCLGTMVKSAPYVNYYDWLHIFYKSTAEREEDYLTISDYFFRYDTECHWLTKTVPLMETFPARLLLGKLILGSTNLITWSKRLSSIMKLKKRPEVIVDVFIPATNFRAFFTWYKKEYRFYPLWIVPYKAPSLYPWIDSTYGKGLQDTLFIDCAVYGKKNNDPKVDYSEVLEKKTIELNGIKTLISRNHFDRETFWKVYNRTAYTSVKNRVDPDNLFNELFRKMCS